ncbi:MAG TPA: NAD-dependent epimerase/dehydratase family protein, partial [Alphaproteobacteria bacterium]|nr:NAD-dependent epimerase/dehydratase family protein [Alphaproteobacteria bacterium]
GAIPVHGDLRQPARWIDAVEGVDAVIHAAATFTDDMGAVDHALMDRLLPRMPAGSALVYTGGCWLYGETGDRVADEETPFDPLPAFAWMVEPIRRVLSATGIRGIVVHPAMVFEQGGGVFTRFAEEARHRGRIGIVGGEAVRWPLVHKEDLADLYLRALERGMAGTAYNGAAIDGLPVGRIARAIAKRLGAIDEPEVRSADEIAAELGDWARGYALDQRMSGDRARRDLGWSPTRTDPLADPA